MQVRLNLNPEIGAKLDLAAKSAGKTIECYVESILEREILALERSPSSELTGPEKAAAFRKWVASFPPNLPVLPMESISREKIYEEE